MGYCRLARAQKAAGDVAAAKATAQKVENRLESYPEVSPEHGPEIYFTLQGVFGEDDRGLRYLGVARDMVADRSGAMRNESDREHYLANWPSNEIIEEARRSLGR